MKQQAKQPLPRLIVTSAEHASAALRWFDTMRRPEEWRLSIEEQLELLRGVKKRTFQGWKKKALEGEPVKLSCDTMERLRLLLGIYKGLKSIAPADRMDVARQWFNTANSNPLFGGASPKELLMTVGTMESLYAVRRYLDAASGQEWNAGW